MSDLNELKQLQMLPLAVKIQKTQQRLKEWVDTFGVDGVYISFSGGKDSTVLLHIARQMYPKIKAVFSDTGLEFPEVREFVKTFDNVDWVKPEMTFKQVIEKYGYPFISKEVSECVYGARKYLTKILEENQNLDRQTDRQTDRPYRYRYHQLTGTGAYQKHQRAKTTHIQLRDGQNIWNLQSRNQRKDSAGVGYDNKFRKLRGIGEYSKSQNGEQRGRKQSEISNHVGDADKGQGTADKSECP